MVFSPSLRKNQRVAKGIEWLFQLNKSAVESEYFVDKWTQREVDQPVQPSPGGGDQDDHESGKTERPWIRTGWLLRDVRPKIKRP